MALPWDEIKMEYLTTDTSYRKLAKKYGCSDPLIARRAKKEGWYAEKQGRQKAITAAVSAAAQIDADTVVNKLCALREAAEAAVDIARERLKAPSQMSGQDYRSYVAGLKDLNIMLRDFYDIPTPAQREQLAMARERLELEKQRIAPDDTDNDMHVTLDDGAEDYAE